MSYCLFAITFTNPLTDVVPLLLDYFVRSDTRGTTETQRLLAQALFIDLGDLFKAEQAFLTALGIAAEVLGHKEADRLVPGLKVKAVEIATTGRAAQRLSDLIG